MFPLIRKSFSLFMVVVTCILLPMDPLQAEEGKAQSTPSSEVKKLMNTELANHYMEEMKRQYLEAAEVIKENKEMPQEALDWFRQDIKNINTWEYRVAEFSFEKNTDAENFLNSLGAERWEVVALVPSTSKSRLILKRPRKSYLKALPVKDILRMMQGEQGSE